MSTIIQINTTQNVGSHGCIAEQLGLKVIAQGGVSYFAYGRTMHESTSKSIKIGDTFSIRWHVLMTRLFDTHGLWSKRATRQFVRKLEEIKPDLVHLHNIHGYYLNYPILFEYLSKTNIPIVWTFHDCWPMMGHCSNPDNEGCIRWKSGCHHCPLKSKDYPQSFLFDNSRRNYELKKHYFTSVDNLHIVTVSNWLKSVVNESFLNGKDTRVIYNGIDTELFRPTESHLKNCLGLEGKYIILGVSNIWWSIKGFDDFIKLAGKLNDDYRIVLIGVGDKELKQLPSNIIGIPRTSNQAELVEYYSMADVVMSLSYQETFGLTIVEGMACGTPAIVYDRTATPELVTPDTGIVAHAGDIDSVVNAILKIQQKGKTFYSSACRQRAVEHFNKDDRFQDYINLYNELLNEKSCSR